MPWSDLLRTTGVLLLSMIPLGVSLWALLDAAKRPQWAWSLADRNRTAWMAAVMVGLCSMIGGLLISGWYLLRVRPVVAAAESGQVPVRQKRPST